MKDYFINGGNLENPISISPDEYEMLIEDLAFKRVSDLRQNIRGLFDLYRCAEDTHKQIEATFADCEREFNYSINKEEE